MSIWNTNVVIIRFTFWTGILFLVSSALLFAVVVIHRMVLTRRQKRQEAFFNKWRQILLDNLYMMPDKLSVVAAKDTVSFMLLWNNLQETLQGEAKDQLNVLARALEIDQRAVTMLEGRSTSMRLLAMATLGHLKHEASWQQIEAHVSSRVMTLSIHALHALCRINPLRAVNVMVSYLLNTDDWPEYRIANILYEMGPASFSLALREAALRAQPEKQVRLLNLMRYSDRATAVPTSRQLLETASSEDVLAACLNLLSHFGDSRDVALVKHMLQHSSPVVRIRAVSTLGHLASEGDLKALQACLSDPTWWVRYRAALAIASIPGITREQLARMRDTEEDRYAVDILNYVLSQ